MNKPIFHGLQYKQLAKQANVKVMYGKYNSDKNLCVLVQQCNMKTLFWCIFSQNVLDQ